MRHVLIAAAALAAGGLLMSNAALAQQGAPPYVAGGPVKVGSWCLMKTDSLGNDAFGYYAPCGQQAVASAPRRTRR
jgi:hypothetical protein